MSNPIYSMFNQASQLPPVLQQFMQFKKSFRGDAKSQVQQMLNSGQITQAQYNQAVEMAKQFQQLLK